MYLYHLPLSSLLLPLAYAVRPEQITLFGLPLLFIRQATTDPCASQGQKQCGLNCIDNTYSCCPDGGGGCPANEYCALGTNGVYGCCPNGQRCTGAGTAITTAAPSPTGLACPTGRKLCGTGCILLSETCCPGGQGGCPLGETCALGNNGQYGCCPNGHTCTGPGGTSIPPTTVTVTAVPSSEIIQTATGSLGSATAAGLNGGSPTSSSGQQVHKKSHTGAIVGGVIGAIALLVIMGILIFFFVIKPRRKKEDQPTTQSSEPKPDAGIIASGTAAATTTSHNYTHPQEMLSPNHAAYNYPPSSPQWSPPPAGYPPNSPSYAPPAQGYQHGYQYPQQPAGSPLQSPPPSSFVPQPGQQQNQPGYHQPYPPAGSPLNAELPATSQPQQYYNQAPSYPSQGLQEHATFQRPPQELP